MSAPPTMKSLRPGATETPLPALAMPCTPQCAPCGLPWPWRAAWRPPPGRSWCSDPCRAGAAQSPSHAKGRQAPWRGAWRTRGCSVLAKDSEKAGMCSTGMGAPHVALRRVGLAEACGGGRPALLGWANSFQEGVGLGRTRYTVETGPAPLPASIPRFHPVWGIASEIALSGGEPWLVGMRVQGAGGPRVGSGMAGAPRLPKHTHWMGQGQAMTRAV